MDRRVFIRSSSTFIAATVGSLSCGFRPELNASALAADAMDEALSLTSRLGPFGNHAPMAVESLVALGRTDRLIPFIEKYKLRFRVGYPDRVQRIDATNWKEALGQGDRNSDWVEFFTRELKENDWKAVIEKWTAILAPGLCAAAGHGVIRTCHATRSLSQRETEHRRYELAEGLGYWAAYYQPLPTSSKRSATGLTVDDAVQRVPFIPESKRRRGSFMEQLRALDDFAEFAGVIDLVEIKGKPEAQLSSLTETFSRIYLERVTDRNDLLLLHAITATSGLRSLLPYLSPATTGTVLAYGWQTAAGLLSISGSHAPRAIDPSEVKKEDLVERAVSSNEEHAIKFTEACLREHRVNPTPLYLQAAHEAVRRLPRY